MNVVNVASPLLEQEAGVEGCGRAFEFFLLCGAEAGTCQGSSILPLVLVCSFSRTNILEFLPFCYC